MSFSVVRQQPELVRPATPTPSESKYLSDIDDQEALRFQAPVIISYRKNHLMAGIDPATVIKESLSKALVFYYPFAGRLREGANRKLIVDCTGEGVLFIEADACVTLEQIRHKLLPPCPILEEILFDVPGSSGITCCPLFLFQVTRLTCGGFILGIRVNHVLCDFVGLLQFLNAMAELAREANMLSLQPVWQRDIFKARDPPIVTCKHYEYDEVISATKDIPPGLINSEVTVQGSLSFSRKEIQSLRNKLIPDHRQTCTNFELLSACIWKCRTIALQPNPKDLVRYSCFVNIRNIRGVALHPGFYGNAVLFPAVTTEAKPLMENPLDYALKLVQESKSKATREYVRSAIDFLVVKGRTMYVDKLHWVASNITRIGIRKLDLGFATGDFVGVPRGIGKFSNFSRFKVSDVEEEDIIVVALELPAGVMSRLREEVNKMTDEEKFELKDEIGDKDVKMAARSML